MKVIGGGGRRGGKRVSRQQTQVDVKDVSVRVSDCEVSSAGWQGRRTKPEESLPRGQIFGWRRSWGYSCTPAPTLTQAFRAPFVINLSVMKLWI
jgi:hypothetical protein